MLQQRPTQRERAGIVLSNSARLAFAGLLFTSPWMIQWVDVQRRVGSVYSGFTDFFVYPSDLFLVLTLLFGLLTPFVAGKRFQRGPWYLTLPLCALVALSFISAIFSVDAYLTLYHSLRLALLLGLYFVILNVLLPPAWIAVPLAFAVLIQGGVAILQFIKQASLGLQYWGEQMLDPTISGVSILRIGDEPFLRAYGLTDHPNLLGGFLAFALIYVLGYYLATANHSRLARGWARYFLLIPLAVGIVALFYTFSRSAQLAFVAGIVILCLASLRSRETRRRRLRDLAVVALLSVIVLSVPVVNNQRLLAQRAGLGNAFLQNAGEARSLVERDELIASANRIFYARQLLGVGSGAITLGMYYLDKEFPKDVYYYQPAHLVILDAASEMGVVGGFLWLWLMFVPLVVMWIRRALLIADPWAAAVAAVVVVTLVVGFFDYYTWFWQPGRIWQWSAWGLFAAVVGLHSRVLATAKFREREILQDVTGIQEPEV